jgi:hypothetical protein
MIIRHWLTFGSIGIALGFLATTADFTEAKKYSGGYEKSSIYFKSQKAADAALEKFDKHHPDCQLWTNWQKMCSRIGRSGKNTHCNKDHSFRAKPTRPFCLSNSESQLIDSADELPNSSDHELLNIFCTRFRASGGLRVCEEMLENRPFNGRSLAALRHPFCEIWGQGGQNICSENGSVPGLPKCSKIDSNVQSKEKYYCQSIRSGDEDVVRSYGCGRVVYSNIWPNDQGYKYPDLEDGYPIVNLGRRKLKENLFFNFIYCID